ncbi:PREDICTED: zinc finger protein 157-like isoform X1 [Dinoponera quadriceps]|uniref:Zinc finger protein 157-like isoform X1 n=1 Tax=Dinoponera quadriceps TaxID=609295 RepID=A0A6P3XUM9_DINQU|nr:PREDICTED: zinc finger protein 157-like isoform X1 [Dinoponera quadriceps]
MDVRNSTILESSSEDSILFETVKSIAKGEDRKETENEEDFFLMSLQEKQYSSANVKEAATTYKRQTEEMFQWTDLCRICANANDHLIPIFEGEGAELDLSSKIFKYLPIHVSKNDTLPLQLCYHCAVTLLAWHQLSKDCLNAEKKLLEIQDVLQNKQQNDDAASFINSDVSIPVISTISTVSNIAISPIDRQTDCRNSTHDTEGNVSNRCGPAREKPFAAYCSARNAARWASDRVRKCESELTDATAKLTPTAEKAREISERKTCENSSDSSVVEFDEKEEDSSTSKRRYLKSAKKGYTCDHCRRVFNTKHHLAHHMASCESHSSTNRTGSSAACVQEAGKNRKIDDNSAKRENSSRPKGCAKSVGDDEGHGEAFGKPLKKRSSRSYPCRYCEYTAEKKKLLSVHLTEAHSEFARKNRKSFVDTESVLRARMVHDGKVYYHCGECGKNLNSPYTFYWHIRIHTGERLFTCHMCGKRFRVNQGLARHLKETHAGVKNVPCDLCGRMFSTRRNAEDHRRIHTGERPYVCNVCGKTFKQKASLFVHNRTHSDVFPFKCSYCGQTFRTRSPLMVHITKHTGEKPYACDVCGRCFRIKYELKRHRLIHSDEKPWRCTDCDLSFRQKRYLINHKRLNHEPPCHLIPAK